MFDDINFGNALDSTSKSHAQYEPPVYQYEFGYTSEIGPTPRWWGMSFLIILLTPKNDECFQKHRCISMFVSLSIPIF